MTDNPFEKTVKTIHEALKKVLTVDPPTPSESGEVASLVLVDANKIFETLFKHYTDRMLADNERIWRTGALFVPISLAAFAAFAAIKCPQVWHILVLGIPSVGLMFAWIVVAENHRSFQQNSEAWLVALRRVVGLDLNLPNQLPAGGMEDGVTARGAIQKMRWLLLAGVATLWALTLCWAVAFWLWTGHPECLSP